MSNAITPTLASAQAISLLESTLGSLPGEMAPTLFHQTMMLLDMDREGLSYEAGVIAQAMESGDGPDWHRALDLYQRPSRLFYRLAPHAEMLRHQLHVTGEAPIVSTEQRPEDLSAQLAWNRLAAGAMSLLDMGTLYDPIGDLSGGAIAFLDRRGLQAHWLRLQEQGRITAVPPAAFGLVSSRNESPARLEKYNRGDFDRIGDVAFDFRPELQLVVPPRAYAPLLRQMQALQFVIPSSDYLDTHFSVDWAKSLPAQSVVASGMKGLPVGRTPMEYFNQVFDTAKRQVPFVAVLGYLPSTRWIKEQRLYQAGEGAAGEKWNILLASQYPYHAMELARRWAGPDASIRSDTYVDDQNRSVPVTVVENSNYHPPLRITIVSDRYVIRANELASIYKNLEAIHLGRLLFDKMYRAATDPKKRGRGGDYVLYNRLAAFYQTAMREAEEDITAALSLEKIPVESQIILPEVTNDMYGSWRTKSFEEMYALVRAIFDPDSTTETWSDAMVLLKLRIREYYSVRNPCYGFCLAADRAAVMSGRWLSAQGLAEAMDRLQKPETIERLKMQGLLPDDFEGKLPSLGAADAPHFFFSMIPDGLSPEGLQIAEQLPVRYSAREMQKLPESFRETYVLVQRMQHPTSFAPEVHRQIIDLSKAMAEVTPASSLSEPVRYVELLKQMRGYVASGLKILEASEHVFQRSRDTLLVLSTLVEVMDHFIEVVRANPKLRRAEIALLNQGIMECLTLANLFYVLPPEEARQELLYMGGRLRCLLAYAQTAEFPSLFPELDSKLTIELELARKLTKLRRALFGVIGPGLVSLTYEMNVRLHSDQYAITKKTLVTALNNMASAVDSAGRQIGEDPGVRSFFECLAMVMWGIRDEVQQKKKLDGHQSLLVYQALIDALIHTRRFMVFPEEFAAVELQYTVKRFGKILSFLKGEETSPLWFFGRNKSRPPVDEGAKGAT